MVPENSDPRQFGSYFWLHYQRERERKQINVFERKVCRTILGPVYDNEKENWRILTNKGIYAMIKNPTVTETVRLNRLPWFGHIQRMEENRIPKKYYIRIWKQQG